MDNNNTQKKEIVPVVSATAVTRKKKTTAMRFKEDAVTVGGRILKDYLVPGLKKLAAQVVKNGVDIILFGEPQNNHNNYSPWGTLWGTGSYYSYNPGSGWTPYGQAYKKTQDGKPPTPSRRTVYDYDYIQFATIADAEKVLNTLKDLISHYGIISVAEFYQTAGVPSNFNDNKYGWTDISSATVEHSDGGYVIRLPKAYPIEG